MRSRRYNIVKNTLVAYAKAALDEECIVYGDIRINAYIKWRGYAWFNGRSQKKIQDDFWYYLINIR